MRPFFIHIPKNGGMTIRRSPLVNVQVATENTHASPAYTAALKKKMKQTNDHPGIEHCPLRFINASLWFNHRPFAIVRNPWDRVVSRYFFAKKVIEVEKKVPASYADVSSFENFFEERHKWGSEDFMWHRAVRGWYPALFHVSDKNTGRIAHNVHILRFENYNEDFRNYFKIKSDPQPRNVTALNKRSYRDIYTPETIQIVADWYKDDIDTWGYDFDTGPTRNTWALK